MASQTIQMLAAWERLEPRAQQIIYTLATILLSDEDVAALDRIAKALQNESPEPNATPL